MRFDLFTRFLMPVFFTLLFWGTIYGQTNVTDATVSNLTVTNRFESITPDANNLISTAGKFTRKVGVPLVDGAGNQINIGIQSTLSGVTRNAAIQGFIHDTNAFGLKFQTMDSYGEPVVPVSIYSNETSQNLEIRGEINYDKYIKFVHESSDISLQKEWQLHASGYGFSIQRYGYRNDATKVYETPFYIDDDCSIEFNSPGITFNSPLVINKKLSVSDTLILKKGLRINNWTLRQVPDYVFDSSYALKPLHEVEKYVKENRHLPDIPSAEQIVKNGVDLTEMNMLLLKKIEELTLYTIDQQKKIEGLTLSTIDQQKKIENLTFSTIDQQKQIDELRTIVKEDKKEKNDKK